MKKKQISIFSILVFSSLVIIIIVVSIYSLGLSKRADALSQKNSNLENEYSDYKSSSDGQIQELQAELSNLTDENARLAHQAFMTESLYNQKIDEYNELRSNHTRAENKIELLSNQMKEFEQQISESLQWYRSNAILSDNKEQSKVKSKLDFYCVKEDQDTCTVRLGCFWLVNQEFLGLRYKYDILSVDDWDRIISLDEFLKNGGGDCEDYALFFKAQLNYVLDECRGRDIVL